MSDDAGLVGSQADYARHCGVSRQAVSKWLKAGRIEKLPDGRIDFVQADRALQKTADPARALAMGRADPMKAAVDDMRWPPAKLPVPSAAVSDSGDGPDDGDLFAYADAAPQSDSADAKETGDASYQKNRALRERYNAKMAELDYFEKVGRVLDKQDVEDAMVTAGRRIRQAMDAIPAWADEIYSVAQGGDVQAVRAILKGRIRGLEETIVASLTTDEPDSEGDQQ
ncbi:hypothetical protein [Thalassospira marina]|uniref:Terminase small subunit n=1 Tax=Thalassospira marina TaxID=2048283 RepID=A0A2N3KVB8_9PROT|nr:hypothetical protein [Thalassospira marina]PKR54413.1 hypothetical protein COO20_09800 [Thalassospira marina]